MDKVSLIITCYLEQTKPYLDLLIRSIENLNYPKDKIETILVGRQGYMPTYENVKTIAPPESEFHNPRGLNFGFHAASKDCKYFLLLNDDVCLTKNSLKNLVEIAGDHLGIFNPICHDNQNCYWLEYPCPRPTLEELQNIPGVYINLDSAYRGGLFSLPFVCMFSTLIPRKVWELVGDWDEGFLTGQDDLDWTYRCKQKGVGLFSVLNSFVYHAGGRSADITMTSEKRKQSKDYFEKKWGFPPTLG